MLTLNDITNAVLKYHPHADVDVILHAYYYSAKAHRGQSRVSGEAYFSHPVAVAYNLTRLKMDEQTVAAGLLHDTLEDTLATPLEIKENFGEEIYRLVEGVTKIGQVEFSSKEEKQAENYRKMILAMAEDIRVVLIKLADRAHNLKTLGPLSEARQKRIAQETLDIYAPLANRLGIGWIKTELENLSFRYLFPEEYKEILEKVAQGDEQRKIYVQQVEKQLAEELEASAIPGEVVGRYKQTYSIFRKMKDQGISFDEVYDLIGLRVITDSVKNCYSLLGLVHSLWKPIPGKFKDYIAMPKPNMYQSLHTTVVGPDGFRVEVQIRSEDMHRVAEEGIAAHWHYKEGGGSECSNKMEEPLNWVRRLIENQKDLTNPKEFLNAFKVDLFPHEVYVFTPQGEVVTLPTGASPVDFAYQVHTDIGHHCDGVKVNGRTVPLRYRLRNGDCVEIITREDKRPSREWLAFIKTAKARHKIVSFLNSEERAKSLRLGRELLEKEIMKYGQDPKILMGGEIMEEAIRACGTNSLEALLQAVGYGKISPYHVVEKLVPREVLQEFGEPEKVRVKLKEGTPTGAAKNPIQFKCLADNIPVRIGKCCNPLPGDPIIGYITRGRGISVHHEDCSSVAGTIENEAGRIVEVGWGPAESEMFTCRISIVTQDKPGLLANISGALANYGINITRANVRGANKRAYFDLTIEIENLDHLNRTFEEVKKVEGVIHVERVKEHQKKLWRISRENEAGENLSTTQDPGISMN